MAAMKMWKWANAWMFTFACSNSISHYLHICAAGVPMHSTLDSEGKETFHLQSLHYHLTLKNETVLQQPPKDALNSGPWGEKCCSNYPVSFHYVKPVEMYMFEYLLYNASVHMSDNRDSGHL
ncbi:glycoprotein-N-acetylgalactosamine 3-beta-galactosyltransferase 1-like isoform X3 [Dreissena polymorpha]|uniref:glycoprotein-N-acetylgalactosamine 3-beta-galactosyltransferase 1-like isoform X3 n=1 Tax=Dreissena polymorpha TaxID=45954 RepID=UPI002264FAA1|nr:glycoprotein-N-acetylgalactosamine 3-beta-galactosyltransferase 1-like isoform X3 [Dreissena polymorpha]